MAAPTPRRGLRRDPPPLSRIVLTTGEPAGIGPDLAVAAAMRDWPCELVFAGDPALLQSRAELLDRPVTVSVWQPGDEPRPQVAGRMPVLALPLAAPVTPGRIDTANAAGVLAQLDAAIDGCLAGRFAAMVTAPVQKSALAAPGRPFSGHTEYLAARSGAPQPVMLLIAGTLRVALATTHLPLAAVPAALSVDGLVQTLEVLDRGLKQWLGIALPRIAVCGLNPHAGESGQLGHEDGDVIAPAIAEAAARGIRARGPLPADTAFTPAALAEADAVLAMYHDQGLPVVKHAGFGRAVNVTLGLPFLRTSVDHGTALDLAGSGRADPGSLFEAIALAARLAPR